MRLQVKVSDDMVERIDRYCKDFGVSRSALCSVAIGQYISGLDKSSALVSALGDDVVESIRNSVLKNE